MAKKKADAAETEKPAPAAAPAPAEKKATKTKAKAAEPAPAPPPPAPPAPAPVAEKSDKKPAKGKKAAAAEPAPAPVPATPAAVAATPGPKPKNKTTLVNEMAAKLDADKKLVAKFFDELAETIVAELGPTGTGVFQIPGVVKLSRVHKEATPEHEAKDRFTGKMTTVKAKPASTKIRSRILKDLKELES